VGVRLAGEHATGVSPCGPSPARLAPVAALRPATGRESVDVVGRHADAVYPDGIGRSKPTAALIEARLRQPRHRA